MLEDIKQAAFANELEKIAAGNPFKELASQVKNKVGAVLRSVGEAQASGSSKASASAMKILDRLNRAADRVGEKIVHTQQGAQQVGGAINETVAKAQAKAETAGKILSELGQKGLGKTTDAYRGALSSYKKLPKSARMAIQYGGVGAVGAGGGFAACRSGRKD